MEFEWDDDKRLSNLQKHKLDFKDVHCAFTDTAFVIEDDREDYGEKRYILLGTIFERIVVIIFTIRTDVIRIISMRKANKREQRKYVQEQLGKPGYDD